MMSYELEPPDDSSDADENDGETPSPAEASDDDREAEPAVELLGERCPSCGAALHEPGALVCLGCGWDQRALEQRDTAVGADEIAAPAAPLVVAQPTDRWLPPGIALVALAALLVGLLSGSRGLFPVPSDEAVEVIAWADRFQQLGRLPIVLLVWSACGMGAFAILSWLEVRPIGDARALGIRVLAAVCAARCAKWIALSSWPFVEFTVESLAAAAIYFVLVLALFRLTVRQSAIALAVTVGGYFVALLLATLVLWAV